MRVAWVGTGVMGNPMCGHLLDAGYDVNVHTRSKEKVLPLLERGAVWCATPAEAAAGSEIFFSIVGDPEGVREVLLGPEGALEGIAAGSVLVDLTTSTAALACEVYEQARMKGVAALDAPVSGGEVGARKGTLTVMIGGDEPAVERVLPLLECFGKTVRHMGGSGEGQHTKMANQILVANTIVGVVETLLYAEKAGMDQNRLIEVLGSGTACCWSLLNHGPKIVEKDFDPGFYIFHFVKDLGLALDEAKRMGIMLPGLAAAHQFYISAMAQGLEKNGIQGLYKVLHHLNSQR